MRQVHILLWASGLAVCGGCTIQRLAPPLEGSVVDARTGRAISAATVAIRYFDAARSDRTDSEGTFAFAAHYKVFPLVPLPLGQVSGFSLEASADGYRPAALELHWYYLSSEHPPHEIPAMHTQPYRMVYTGKLIAIDPIRLERAVTSGPSETSPH
jgi:hypothetical protein